MKIPNKISNKVTASEQYVTVSLGVYCQKPTTDTNTAEFVEKADKALYRAKENGKNQARVF